MKQKVIFLFLVLFSQLALASWEELEQQNQSMVDELNLRQEVEKSSYFFGKNLCYIYLHQLKHPGTFAVNNTLPITKIFDPWYWYTDTEYQDSMISWYTIGAYGFISPFYDGDSEYLILARARIIQRLQVASGYKKAINECAEKLGVDEQSVRSQLEKDLNHVSEVASFASTGLGTAIGAGAAGIVLKKIGQFVLKSPRAKIIFSKYIARLQINKKIVKTAKAVGLLGTGYMIYQQFRTHSLLKNLVADETGTVDLSVLYPVPENYEQDTWAFRKRSYLEFAKRYFVWIESNPNCKEDDNSQCRLSQDLQNQLKIFKRQRDYIAAKEKELSNIITSKNVTAETLRALIEKKSKGALSDSEQDLLDDVTFNGILDLLLKLTQENGVVES